MRRIGVLARGRGCVTKPERRGETDQRPFGTKSCTSPCAEPRRGGSACREGSRALEREHQRCGSGKPGNNPQAHTADVSVRQLAGWVPRHQEVGLATAGGAPAFRHAPAAARSTAPACRAPALSTARRRQDRLWGLGWGPGRRPNRTRSTRARHDGARRQPGLGGQGCQDADQNCWNSCDPPRR